VDVHGSGSKKIRSPRRPGEDERVWGRCAPDHGARKITYGWIRRGKEKLIATISSRTRLNLMGTLDLEQMNLIATHHETLNGSAMEVHFQKIRAAYPRALNLYRYRICGFNSINPAYS
jgi:hypothetical protein